MSALPEEIELELSEVDESNPLEQVQSVELAEAAQAAHPTRIVTGISGHDFEGSPAVRAKAALTENGVLYLAEGALGDVLVRNYIAMLDRRGRLTEGESKPYHDIRTVPYTEIQRIYELAADDAAGGAAAGNRTVEQTQVNNIITEAVAQEASDIFFEELENSAEVQYRIAGDIERRFALKPERVRQLIRTIYDSMCESTSDQAYDGNRDQSGLIDRKHTQGLGLHKLRVSTGPTDEGRVFAALRLHYDLGEPKSLVELGFDGGHEAQINAFMNYSYGIALFSGPTGSGKSTSLANVIGHRQKQDNCVRKVISLEDPPEIPIYGATQKAVLRKGLGREAEGQAWIAGFETLLRWNPDWIIAGELRLRETMDAAVKCALTNHLTWGMLHASSATLVPVRLQESGIEMGYLSDPEIFRLFTNQSLVPQVCPHCSITFAEGCSQLDEGLVQRIKEYCTPDTVRLRGPGCEHCYRGVLRVRTICAEVLTTDQQLLDIFREKGALALRKHWVCERGGQTKTAHMIKKINAGVVSPTDAERIVLPINADASLWRATS